MLTFFFSGKIRVQLYKYNFGFTKILSNHVVSRIFSNEKKNHNKFTKKARKQKQCFKFCNDILRFHEKNLTRNWLASEIAFILSFLTKHFTITHCIFSTNHLHFKFFTFSWKNEKFSNWEMKTSFGRAFSSLGLGWWRRVRVNLISWEE